MELRKIVERGVGASEGCRSRLFAAGAVPTEWNAKDKWNFLTLSEEFMRVSYHGAGKTDIDAAAVRANRSVPTSGCAVYYYEIEVINAGQNGYIGVGFCGGSVNLNRLPGWERNSFGYHGDDGYAFRESGTGVSYGPPYSTGDVVGCCWNMIEGSIFFTKNGTAFGTAFSNVRGPLYPTVGLRTPGEIVEANFGADEQTRPFRFDIETYVRDVRDKVLAQAMQESALVSYHEIVTETVLNFMIHHGYAASAAVFARDTGREESVGAEVASTLQRQRICRLVLDGQIRQAIDAATEMHPDILENDEDTLFQLRCQEFIELIRRKGPIGDILAFGKQQLSQFLGKRKEFDDQLSDVFSLLAFSDPSQSEKSSLLEIRRREPVAAALNGAILAAQNQSRSSALERIVSHTIVAQEACAAVAPGASSLVCAKDFL